MTTSTPHQLSLNVYLSDDATFENYFVAPDTPNFQALQAVRELVVVHPPEPFIYLWGPEGAGISHLLQAACHQAGLNALRSQYLPLEELAGYAPEQLLEGLEELDLVCLDGVQHVMGQQGWDHAMFHLYNRLRDKPQCRLLVSADCAPRDLSAALPDLLSRMGWGVVFHLQPLDDAQKMLALKLRARARGIELSDEVLAFILNRSPRDMAELFYCLDRLDTLSLAEKRRITIPFVKETMGW